MRVVLRFALPGLCALLAAACATYPTMEERSAMLGPKVQYFEPASGGQAPLVILMSGCGGLVGADGQANTIMEKYAKIAANAGAYAIVVDSFTPRGIDYKKAVSSVCTGMQLRGNARAGDVLAAEALAEQHWNRKFPGIVLSGWSHGSWSIMELMHAGPEAKQVGNLQVGAAKDALSPVAVSLFYPYCGFLNGTGKQPWAFTGPLLLATAEKDTIGKPEDCRKIVAGARPGMTGVEDIVFPAMTHAFDEESQAPDSAFKYDPENSAKASELYGKFIADSVRDLKK